MAGDLKSGTKHDEWIESYWPVGRYRLRVFSADVIAHKGLEDTETNVEVTAGEGPLVLPSIELAALPAVRLKDQSAPELDATDLNSGKPVRLADFRGKVVVLDFWGYWCGPCVSAMPELGAVQRRFRDCPVVFLALHDQSIQSRAAYDKKIEAVKRDLWDNRDLPFQVALDRPDPNPEEGADASGMGHGVTCRRYEIKGFPTTVVVDQNGKMAGQVNVRAPGELESLLKRLLQGPPAR
jgi:thiol-disulfide isomerase/thioredoxin